MVTVDDTCLFLCFLYLLVTRVISVTLWTHHPYGSFEGSVFQVCLHDKSTDHVTDSPTETGTRIFDYDSPPFISFHKPLEWKATWSVCVFQVVKEVEINTLSVVIGHPHSWLEEVTMTTRTVMPIFRVICDVFTRLDSTFWSVVDMDCSGDRIRIRLELG